MNKEMMEFYEQEESTNIKDFLMRLLANWYWFVACAILGLIIAFVVTKTQPEQYQVNASLLMQEDSKASGMDAIFGMMDMGGKSNVDNHLEVLKSYTIIEAALKNINSDVQWSQPAFFKDTKLYNFQDLAISFEPKEGMNPAHLPIHITVLDNNKYTIEVDGDYLPKNTKEKVYVDFVAEASFGKPFVNEFFDFTITKLVDSEQKDYIVSFNDLNDMVLDYQERLSVSLVSKKADVIGLSMKGAVPAMQVDFLNSLISEFSNFGLRIKNRTSENMVKFIDEQMLGVTDSLKSAGESFTSFRSKNTTVNLGEEAMLVVEALKKLESEAFMAKMRADYYSNLSAYMSNPAKMKEMVTPSVVGITDMGLNALVVRLGELYAKRGVLSTVAYESNPSLVMLDKEIEQLRGSLSENLKNLMANSQVELKGLSIRRTKLENELKTMPAKEQQLINIKRNFDVNNELFTFLLKKRAESAITAASNVSDVEVIDRARVRTAQLVGPKKAINMLIGLFLGLGLPFAILVLRDFFANTVRSKAELEKLSNLPIYGVINHNDSTDDLQVVNNPRSLVTECFRSLRTNLHYLLTDPSQKVISVHSMVPSEGKSFTSVSLASILAMNDKRVLLVGCDLRKPRLHTVFGVDNFVGLSNLLIGDASFEKVVKKTMIKNLSLLVAGPVPPNPAELLGRKEFSAFIEQARADFDFVILDNAPDLLVTDASLASAVADANLFVVRNEYSRTDNVKLLDEHVEKMQLRNVGLVFNDVKAESITYSYGGSGYYGDESMNKPSFWKRLFK